jgi:large subunit ribosomal protein L19e
MTDLRNQKRVASELLDCGGTRVWIDPLHADEVAEAVTRADVRNLIKKGYVKKLQSQGVSRGRARKLNEQKAKGRRKGPGSRKGAAGARDPRKQRWMRTIRALRVTLRELRETGKIDASAYRKYYMQAKGGRYRSKAQLIFHMKTDGVLKEEA